MRCSSFDELVYEARTSFLEHGFPGVLEIVLSREQVLEAQREELVAKAMVEQALRPSSLPPRAGCRLLAVVHTVPIYVRE